MCVQARGVMGGAWTGACAESDWMMRVYAKKKDMKFEKKTYEIGAAAANITVDIGLDLGNYTYELTMNF